MLLRLVWAVDVAGKKGGGSRKQCPKISDSFFFRTLSHLDKPHKICL